MNKALTFSVIGGDKRQLCVAASLANDGHRVRIFGHGRDGDIYPRLECSESVCECVADADAVILPLPYSTSGDGLINAPLCDLAISTTALVSAMSKASLLFAGKADDFIKNLCLSSDITLTDYAGCEELAVMNAVPTAEGALELALRNTPHTVFMSRCLVIGYGRIGKVLASCLKSLGASVTATARKKSDLAWISIGGHTALTTDAISHCIGQFDIVFNTVPFVILDDKALSATKKDVLIIDLASNPGGVDFETAKRLGRHTIHALSLPGKVAPVTAGEIIKNTIVNIIEDMEV